ncbi:MAG: hypothetical protein JNL82_11035 [Myxococcales bacterium]|nr:hypothetical protein [Myxococcales bacterium]
MRLHRLSAALTLLLASTACGASPGDDTGAASSSSTSSGPATTSTSTGDAPTSTTAGETTTGTTAEPTTGGSTTGEPVACGEGSPPAEPIAWDRGQPDISGCEVRGYRDYRAIIHLHSHHSHDACDGDPQPGGVPDEDCLAHLREALCVTRIDVAFTTDHPAHATSATLEELLLVRGEDEPILGEGGTPIANRLVCPDGHRVLLLPGIESGEMMPLGLEAHVPDAYGESSPAAFAKIKAVNGVAWVAHTEGRDTAELATLGLDGIELYQLHANLDPDIREEDLGIDPDGFIADVAPFFFGGVEPAPEPDLATLGFVLPNEPSIVALETLGQTQRISISAGTDAHENVLPQKAGDGERIDSYRRMIRWFNNRIRLNEPLTPESARAALRAGNNHIVFESFGLPIGFDFHAVAGATFSEMGSEVTLSDDLTIAATLPRLDPRSPQSATPPAIEGRLIRATGEGRETLMTWTEGSVELAPPGPGVYRVEVWITPRHLAPYLGAVADQYTAKTLPWMYSAALFVRE